MAQNDALKQPVADCRNSNDPMPARIFWDRGKPQPFESVVPCPNVLAYAGNLPGKLRAEYLSLKAINTGRSLGVRMGVSALAPNLAKPFLRQTREESSDAYPPGFQV